jgi:hypothetical protein
VDAGDSGELLFLIETSSADAGFYMIEASGGESAAIQLTLDEAEPLRPQEGSGPVFSLPAGIATHRVLMPVIIRP